MEALLQDIRFGLHQLLRKPRLAALGIGANTSIVSLLDTVLFPLPVHEPAWLVQLFGTVNKGADVTLSSYLNYKALPRPQPSSPASPRMPSSSAASVTAGGNYTSRKNFASLLSWHGRALITITSSG